MLPEKRCLDCNEPIRGRTDKKFCNDQCRNNYNNHLNSSKNAYQRRINAILSRNLRILEELNPTGKIRIQKKKLADKGFSFEYITSVYHTQAGATYYFCYDQGYLPLDEENILIVKREEK